LAATSIQLQVELADGKLVEPQSVLSEGYQDLLTLLFFLEVSHAAARRGQARMLILDDVLQSVDAGVRVGLLSYLLGRFSDWQLFITVHDRLWREQLISLMRQRNHRVVEREVVGWSSDSAPLLRVATFDPRAPLQRALAEGNPASICAEAGRLLEHLLNVMTWTLPTSVTRRQGDKYTIGDMWPGVLKVLGTTDIADIARDVDTWLHLRNLLGAHYNEWADALPLSDATSFGTSVLRLFSQLLCEACHQWVLPNGFRTTWSCKCGAVAFSRL
jgi:hypothetical protein